MLYLVPFVLLAFVFAFSLAVFRPISPVFLVRFPRLRRISLTLFVLLPALALQLLLDAE